MEVLCVIYALLGSSAVRTWRTQRRTIAAAKTRTRRRGGEDPQHSERRGRRAPTRRREGPRAEAVGQRRRLAPRPVQSPCDDRAPRTQWRSRVAMVENRRKMCSVLGAKRRRHKTVHFGGEVLGTSGGASASASGSGEGAGAGGPAEDRGSVHSLPGQFEANVQQLFSFIGSVLSQWERRRTMSRKEAVRLLLRGDASHKESECVGSPSYKHTHWKVPAGSCTALFLNKNYLEL
ncbi:unnamed protein product [Nesidiocoris tenuis]|uniref:Uncharacterized protein n=1 Tax=Nesidiocoris tenuis TaxID=355587 RepID=A0A6H5GIQ0_9HEMI|nr:unnamed protein product [Nesidiocoris tenuis]